MPIGKKTEKVFQSEIRQSLRMLPGPKWYHKIVDCGYQNPFDAILAYKGKSIGLEYKISKNIVSIPLVDLFRNRGHELRYLKQLEKSGGYPYILINIWESRKTNYVIILTPSDYDDLITHVSPKKSIKLDDPFLGNFPKMEKVRVGYGQSLWDLTKFINESIQKKQINPDNGEEKKGE